MEKEILNKFSNKVHSQFGEDGIFLEILRRIGEKNSNKFCVEFGARDGISDSNTYNLIKNFNFRAVLIEGNNKYFKKLCKNFPDNEIIKINKFVDFEGENKLDNLLKTTDIPKNFDILSIDIDGCDFYIFESLTEYRPKIICVEFNHLIPNSVEFVQKKNFDVKQGSSARSLTNLAKKKGYDLIASTLTNLFFIDKIYVNLIYEKKVSIENLIDDEHIKNYVFSSYDGRLHTSKPLKLGWHKLEIKNDKIQILPFYLRYFPDDYNLFQKILFLIYREILNPGRFLRKIFYKKNSK
tara:strand:- start:441 stop:1325 length:885 start_codon:yes stop_codon:yes gene_type:complete